MAIDTITIDYRTLKVRRGGVDVGILIRRRGTEFYDFEAHSDLHRLSAWGCGGSREHCLAEISRELGG